MADQNQSVMSFNGNAPQDEYSTPIPQGAAAQQPAAPAADEYSTPLPQGATTAASTEPSFDQDFMNLKLGEIPGDIVNAGKGFLHGAADTLGGIAKGVAGTGLGIGPANLGDIGNVLQEHGKNTGAPGTSAEAAQDVGYGGETLLEFLGGEGMLNSAKGLADASKIMGIIEKSPKLVKALKVGASALKAGVVQGAQTTARTGDLGEGAKTGAEMAATAGVLGGAGEFVGSVASKLGKAGKTAGELAETAANAPTEQSIKENIQGRLHNAEDALHTNYENKVNDFADRLDGTEIEAKDAPIAEKAKDILQKPDPEDHSFVQQADEARGQKLDKPVRALLENIAEGKKPLTEENIEAAAEANKNKPKLVDAKGKAIESEDVEPEAEDAEPLDARGVIKLRQSIRALAANYEPGDINARALKRLLWDSAEHNSAIDDTLDHLANEAGDPEVVQEYQALRADYRNKISKYDDPVIKNLMQGKPDDAAKAFIGTKNASGLASSGKTQFNLDNLKELLGPEAVQNFGDAVFKNIMGKAIDEGTGFNPAQFLSNWSRVNDATKEQLFGIKAAAKGQAWVDTELQSLAKDAKTAANVQKLTRIGLLSGAGAAGAAHPGYALSAGLGTVFALLAGAKGSGGGIAHARDLIDYVANNPKTWAAFRAAGRLGEAATEKSIGTKITAGAKAVVNQSNADQKRKTYDSLAPSLGGMPKKLTALSDANSPVAADVPSQVQNAVSTIPVEMKKGDPIPDPNNRGGGVPIANVDQGAGNNTIEVNRPQDFGAAQKGHELVHVWQNNLPPSVQAKIPDDPKDMSAFDISDVDKLRKQGKTLSDIPREKAATIVQKYIEAKDPKQKAKLQPWVDDMKSSALSVTMPTSPDAKSLNTTPRAPGLPDSSVAGLNGSTPAYVTPSYKSGKVPGMVQQGNVDLNTRPNIKNPDGSHSSVFSMSFGTDKGEVLVPGVGDGKTYPLRKLTTAEALDQYRKTGNNLGTFKTPAAADAYGAKLHEDQAKPKR